MSKEGRFESVILVDDDPVLNGLNELIISVLNLSDTILKFKDPLAALNFIQKTPPSQLKPTLLLLDIYMTTIDGFEFIAELVRLGYSLNVLKVVVLTITMKQYQLDKLKHYDILGILEKPLTTEELEMLLERC
jgi:response regulator of citrate/malate metabolism